MTALHEALRMSRELARAHRLLAECESVLHSLPEAYRPADLIDRVRLALQRQRRLAMHGGAP